MNNYFKIILIFLALEGSFIGDARAQNYEGFGQIKKQMSELLGEHRRLASRYFSLQEEFSVLNGMVEKKEQEIEVLKLESGRQKLSQQDLNDSIQSARKSIKKNQDNILVKESWIAYLEGELADADEQQKLWNLQLADLERQKRMLQMDLQLKKMEKKKEDKVTIKDLQRVLEDNQEKEKALLRRVVKMEEQIVAQPQKIRKLKQKNEKLVYQIKSLEKRKDLEVRENMNLQDQKMLKKRKGEDSFLKKKSEKIMVEKKVRVQENEYKVLDETLRDSLNYQEEERVLVQEMVNLDKQNLKLKEKIAEMETLIRELEDGLQ